MLPSQLARESRMLLPKVGIICTTARTHHRQALHGLIHQFNSDEPPSPPACRSGAAVKIVSPSMLTAQSAGNARTTSTSSPTSAPPIVHPLVLNNQRKRALSAAVPRSPPRTACQKVSPVGLMSSLLSCDETRGLSSLHASRTSETLIARRP